METIIHKNSILANIGNNTIIKIEANKNQNPMLYPKEQPPKEQQIELDSDPNRQFLRDQDFQGESKENIQEPATERSKEKTPQEERQNIGRTENETLSRLNNPEMSQIVADPEDLREIVREMGGNAQQFENPEKRILAGMAQKNLEQLNQLLSSGKPEDLTRADQVVANYLCRTLSQELSQIFNSAGLPITWEDKKRLLDQSILADKISKRPDILKSRDLISVRRRVREQVSQYLPNQPEQPATTGGRTEEEIEKKKRLEEFIKRQKGQGATEPQPTVQEASRTSETVTSEQVAKTESENDRTTEKPLNAEAKFGKTLSNFIREFQDGTLSDSFTEFSKSNPTPQQYEAAATKLKILYDDYRKDERFRSDKIPEFTERLRDLAKQLNTKQEMVAETPEKRFEKYQNYETHSYSAEKVTQSLKDVNRFEGNNDITSTLFFFETSIEGLTMRAKPEDIQGLRGRPVDLKKEQSQFEINDVNINDYVRMREAQNSLSGGKSVKEVINILEKQLGEAYGITRINLGDIKTAREATSQFDVQLYPEETNNPALAGQIKETHGVGYHIPNVPIYDPQGKIERTAYAGVKAKLDVTFYQMK